MGATKLFSGGANPTVVARRDNGVWVAFLVDDTGVIPTYYPKYYASADCTGPAYAYAESTSAPLFRLVQRMEPSKPAYYAGDPLQVMTFSSTATLMPDNITLACAPGATGPLLTGPVKEIDLSAFPAPLTIQ